MIELTLQQLTENLIVKDASDDLDNDLAEAHEFVNRGADIVGFDCGRWPEDPRYVDRDDCSGCTTWFACPIHYVHREMGMKYLNNLLVRSEAEATIAREVYYSNGNDMPDYSHMCGIGRGVYGERAKRELSEW